MPIRSASWRPGRLSHGFENGNPQIGSGNQIPLCKHTRSTWIGQKDSKEPTGLFWPDNVGQNWKLALMDRDLKEIPATMTVLRGKCAFTFCSLQYRHTLTGTTSVSAECQIWLFSFQTAMKILISQKATLFIRS